MQKYVVGVILLLGCSGSAGSSTSETLDAANEVRADDGRIGAGFGSDIRLMGKDQDAGGPRLDGGAGEETMESADGAVPDPGELGDAGQDAGAREDAGADAGVEPKCVPEKCPQSSGFLACCATSGACTYVLLFPASATCP
jgi:hypothetical protein